MTGRVALDHDMTVGRARSRSGPRCAHHATVRAPMPVHTPSTLAVWRGSSRDDTFAPLYPGSDHGGSNTATVASTSSTAAALSPGRDDVAGRWGAERGRGDDGSALRGDEAGRARRAAAIVVE